MASLPLEAAVAFAQARAAVAPPMQEVAPTSYEVILNGETFRVEGSRMAKLESKEKPGTTYEIAIRPATTQALRLNTAQLEYEMPAKVFDDRGRDERTIKIQHELGFSLLVTDLGEALDAKGKEERLKLLTDSLTASFKAQRATDLQTVKLKDYQFQGAASQGLKMHYKDGKEFEHTCYVYLLSGPKFTVTCVAQFLDNDRDEVLPLIKKTLDSVRGL